MRVPRIYQDIPLNAPMRALLDKQASLHVNLVLKMEKNQNIIVFNGDGFEYHGTLSDIKRDRVEITITHKIEKNLESPLKLHLGQCLARGDRMDFILQKATELGVAEITPLFSRYCNVKLSEDRIEKKIQHWKKVIQSACEQCGRNRLPVLFPPMDIKAWMQKATGAKIYLDPRATQRLFDVSIEPQLPTFLLIGSEGGLSREEREYAESFEFNAYLMGPRILRTETAGLAAISILQTKAGDF